MAGQERSWEAVAIRILMASLPIGTGHDMAAQTLGTVLADDWGAEVHFSRSLEPWARSPRALYFWALAHVPETYGRLYRRADQMGWSRPGMAEAETGRVAGGIPQCLRQAGWWHWNRWYWRWIGRQYLRPAPFRPDWVIATHPFALAAWAGVRPRPFQLLGVVTDLSAHRFWWEPDADAYAVWLPEMLSDLVRCGGDAGAIWQTGIPVGCQFAGVEANRAGPLVVMAGGLGLGPVGCVVDDLVRLGRPIHVICGQNARLFKTLSARRRPHTWVHGYVDNLAAVLEGAAVLVSKPGGLTAAESAAARIPLVVPYCLPGQEQVNVERLVAAGLAVHERSVAASVEKSLTPAVWNGIRERQRVLGRGQAAQDLARTLTSQGMRTNASASQKFLD